MRAPTSVLSLSAALLLGATPVLAQSNAPTPPADTTATLRSAADSAGAPAPTGTFPDTPAAVRTTPAIEIQHLRPVDQRGVNMFETPKHDTVPYTGFKLGWGAAFTQQFQDLSHRNSATPLTKQNATGEDYDANALMSIGSGFNNAVANLYLNAQLAPGIRVAMTTYLSARHHQETWVKDGYLLVDQSPIKVALLERIMEYVTIKAGHFEINYGDAHFRRTDNGNAMYNPLVGNYIMDAFTTQIGGEVYVRRGPWMAMGGITGGEVRGQVTAPEKRSLAYLGKVGYDDQLTGDLRVRLTGSIFSQARSANNTLYTGDRAGSRYYMVMENTTATEKDQAWSGAIQPGFRSETHAVVVNPFIKYRNAEFFGNFEQARGRAATEPANRKWTQNAYELTYRLFGDRAYVAGRYNTASGELLGFANDVSVNRSQLGGGWFLTPNILLKAEYVTQRYHDFPTTDIRSGGRFSGLMVEGVVAF
ncbi:MAG TPA: hypothetical protein VFS08_10295 [Gemmatimonadaceae bacterium]|nr:hypothetical protein [Gemmatimonadaceae bacterium]